MRSFLKIYQQDNRIIDLPGEIMCEMGDVLAYLMSIRARSKRISGVKDWEKFSHRDEADKPDCRRI